MESFLLCLMFFSVVHGLHKSHSAPQTLKSPAYEFLKRPLNEYKPILPEPRKIKLDVLRRQVPAASPRIQMQTTSSGKQMSALSSENQVLPASPVSPMIETAQRPLIPTEGALINGRALLKDKILENRVNLQKGAINNLSPGVHFSPFDILLTDHLVQQKGDVLKTAPQIENQLNVNTRLEYLTNIGKNYPVNPTEVDKLKQENGMLVDSNILAKNPANTFAKKMEPLTGMSKEMLAPMPLIAENAAFRKNSEVLNAPFNPKQSLSGNINNVFRALRTKHQLGGSMDLQQSSQPSELRGLQNGVNFPGGIPLKGFKPVFPKETATIMGNTKPGSLGILSMLQEISSKTNNKQMQRKLIRDALDRLVGPLPAVQKPKVLVAPKDSLTQQLEELPNMDLIRLYAVISGNDFDKDMQNIAPIHYRELRAQNLDSSKLIQQWFDPLSISNVGQSRVPVGTGRVATGINPQFQSALLGSANKQLLPDILSLSRNIHELTKHQ